MLATPPVSRIIIFALSATVTGTYSRSLAWLRSMSMDVKRVSGGHSAACAACRIVATARMRPAALHLVACIFAPAALSPEDRSGEKVQDRFLVDFVADRRHVIATRYGDGAAVAKGL